MVENEFAYIAASVRGSLHEEEKKPNQDAYLVTKIERGFIMCVSDGCGSLEDSHIGSKALVKLATEVLINHLSRRRFFSQHFSEGDLVTISDSIRARLKVNAQPYVTEARPLHKVLQEVYAATLICAVVLESTTYVLCCGDGSVYLNGIDYTIPEFEDNAPPFLVYGHFQMEKHANYNLQLHCQIPTQDLRHLLIASDGVRYLHPVATPISQFWGHHPYFEKPGTLQPALQHLAYLLEDDTTIICLRRGEEGAMTADERVTMPCPPPPKPSGIP